MSYPDPPPDKDYGMFINILSWCVIVLVAIVVIVVVIVGIVVFSAILC